VSGEWCGERQNRVWLWVDGTDKMDDLWIPTPVMSQITATYLPIYLPTISTESLCPSHGIPRIWTEFQIWRGTFICLIDSATSCRDRVIPVALSIVTFNGEETTCRADPSLAPSTERKCRTTRLLWMWPSLGDPPLSSCVNPSHNKRCTHIQSMNLPRCCCAGRS
jgi:hypothetical protein